MLRDIVLIYCISLFRILIFDFYTSIPIIITFQQSSFMIGSGSICNHGPIDNSICYLHLAEALLGSIKLCHATVISRVNLLCCKFFIQVIPSCVGRFVRKYRREYYLRCSEQYRERKLAIWTQRNKG